MKPVQSIVTLMGFAIASTPAVGCASGIYKLVDERGHVTYTNILVLGAAESRRDREKPAANSLQAAQSAAVVPRPGDHTGGHSPAQWPRDAHHYQMLKLELAAETRLLENVLQTLGKMHHNPQPQVQGDVQSGNDELLSLRTRAVLHRRNIRALITELNALKNE
ncbi:DUF4124 domain-containing protein [Nitrosomonas halophila]|uniref:DUF4124 domain-containing protein n=1 Tax=Nitrosomonas halophila TaxID=44576 RepID=A0A1H3D6V2_9PROT|nr:DUF4124 domain-containing protein [Nitrosomonas halophila]SDX62173.1 hypothetical protein SAMN05421881_100471 [Nitrosomonas halophila]